MMAGGRAPTLEELPVSARAIVDEARRAMLATVDPRGHPHVVPICFALLDNRILSAVDQKPKSSRGLARVRNIESNPVAAVTFDRWAEDWTRLGWVMVRGRATIEPPGTGSEALVARYLQYHDDPPAGVVIAVDPETVLWWTWGSGPASRLRTRV